MPVQDEVAWVLETIYENWPELGDSGAHGDDLYGEGIYYDSNGFPDDLYRVNRDEPRILETGERKKKVELTKASVLGASLGSRIPEVAGPDNRRRVTTTVDCRLKGLTSQGGRWGHVKSSTHAKKLALYAQHAIQQELSYPEVDPDADPIGRVDYHTVTVGEPRDRSRDWQDEFFWTWTVQFVGYETISQP